jgi:peptide/nickel transport system permease protein
VHQRRRTLAPLRRRWQLIIGFTIFSCLVLSAAVPQMIAPLSPYRMDIPHKLKPPSAGHWLGTDEFGRDELSRTVYAARISVVVAGVAVGIGLIGGLAIGLGSAWLGGLADMMLMRGMDLLYAFPAMLLAIVIMAGLGVTTLNAMIAIGIIFIPSFARLSRAVTEGVLRQQYIEVAQTIGMSNSRILLREVLPNIAAPMLVQAAVAFAYAILVESALSFLGLGAQLPEPSWGSMINSGRGMMAIAPWLGIVPGAAIFVGVLGFNLLGDGLRDLRDPRLSD